MLIPEITVEKIKEASNIVDVISAFTTLKKKGKDWNGNCPFCGKEKKFSVDSVREIYKCFSCDIGGKGSVDFLMNKEHITFPEALRKLADQYGIIIEENTTLPAVKSNTNPFRDQQLKLSGLTDKDQKEMMIVDENTEKEINRYQAATVNQFWDITHGDDMVMHYLDLHGKPMMYVPAKKNKEIPLIRIRYQNPDLHKSQAGKPKKYDQPYGSRSALWINHWIRHKFTDKIQFDTLFIQEGEKKADKATKHGMLSVGIMGINNIGTNNQLPPEFQLIIKNCQNKNVCLVFDSDWLDIGTGDAAVDFRAKCFLSALKNFHDYFYAFNNIGIHLNIFFAHIIRNDKNEKGIDDLLSGSLKGKEEDLKKDFEKAMLNKDGVGKYVNVFKITGKNEFQLKKYFSLDSRDQFFEMHRDKLKQKKYFKFGKIEYAYNEEKKIFEIAQPLMDDEKYWEEEIIQTRQGDFKKLRFQYENCYRFLSNKKFFRHQQAGKYKFIKVDDKVVREVEPFVIKDFVVDFTKEIGEKEVLQLLYRGAKMYLGPDSVSNLEYFSPQFHRAGKGVQYLYFKNHYWKITAGKIEQFPLSDLDGYVWDKKIIDFDAKIIPDFLKVTRDQDTGKFDIEMQKDAVNCDFFNFLKNASNFYHDKKTLDESEIYETVVNLVNKLCGIGYLMHEFRDGNNLKAVVGMDAKESEIGASNGRTGKSLIGEAVSKLIPHVYIQGKKKDLLEDRFWLEDVEEYTRLIFIDDVRVNFDIEGIFPMITGRIQAEKKGLKKITLSNDVACKIYLTTNHSFNGLGTSFEDRQFKLAFSDYYNDKHKPIDDFGKLFFDEWDYNQWNLFYNLMASCLQVLFQHGLFQPANERLEHRRLRQQIGEDIMEWADLYFDGNENLGTVMLPNIGTRIDKQTMYNNFSEMFPKAKQFINIREFKKRIILYCKYKAYYFNPGKRRDDIDFGGDDKSNGIEYFTISNQQVK